MVLSSLYHQNQLSVKTICGNFTTSRHIRLLLDYTMKPFWVSVAVVVLVCGQKAVGGSEGTTQGEETVITTSKPDGRKPSLFQVGDEWLALPEVFSNLDFSADSSPASEEDIEGQNRLRSSRFWGRLYIDGWPQTIQYFRAHFGIAPPMGKKRFVFAEPREACTDLTNADKLTSDHVLLVNRGTCTYGQKAKIAQKTKASAIVIINNEPGLDHLPGPDAHDIKFSVVSIPQQEGQLLESVYDDGPVGDDGFGRKLEGYLVPINCENSGARCVPATYEERKAVAELVEGGILNLQRTGSEGGSGLKPEELPLEYLLAHFGSKIAHESLTMNLIVAKPAEACGPLENDVKGKAVLVRRGNCPFVKKAEEVQAAGGRIMIVGSLHPYIVRMGVEPRWKGLQTAIPVVMVSKRTYSVLVAETYMKGAISFQEDARVDGAVWEPLEKLHSGEGWPRSEAYVAKKYAELQQEHSLWPDRLLTVDESYKRKTGAGASAGRQGEL